MARCLERDDSVIKFQKCHSGCLRGILHSIHHHRSNLKRILPCRKLGIGNHPMRCRNPKTDSLEHHTQEVHGYPNVDAVPRLVDEEEKSAKVINQSSSKPRMKALIDKEMSGRQGSSMQGRSGLQTSWTSPIIIVQRTTDADSTRWQAALSDKIDESATREPEALCIDRQTSGSKFKEPVDILEIFQVNKKMFLEILNEPEVQVSKWKLKMKRSGTFPSAEPSGTRSLRPSTLEHKKTETWSFPTAENSPFMVQSTKVLASKSDGIGDGKSEVAAISRNGTYSSVVRYVTDLKKKIKNALKHSKKAQLSLERRRPGDDLDKNGVSLVLRSRSLGESIDKYTRLFDNSFNREAPPRVQYQSWSVKLTSNDRNLSRDTSLKTFRRRLSLPDDIDSFLSFPYEASSDQSEPSKHEEQTVVGETDNVKDRAAKAVELHQKPVETCRDEHPTSSVDSIAEDEDRSPVLILDTHFQANAGRSTKSSKGQCLEPSNTSAGQLDRTSEASSAELSANAAVAELDEEDNPDWTDVQDLLYVCGFFEQDRLVPWHSLDQPLSPKLYNELEAFLRHTDHHDEHRLVFDLVNKTLFDVLETRLAYFPMQLSFVQRNTRPLPEGRQVLNEVWEIIRWYRSYGSWKDRSVNDVVAGDFSKDDGWMNLRFDVEDVALDVEDAIFDELLDELIFEQLYCNVFIDWLIS